MGMLVKAALACAIGLAGMAGLQHAWLGTIEQRIYSQQHAGLPEMRPAFPELKIKPVVMPKMPPIDTRAAEAAWAHSHAHNIIFRSAMPNPTFRSPSAFPACVAEPTPSPPAPGN